MSLTDVALALFCISYWIQGKDRVDGFPVLEIFQHVHKAWKNGQFVKYWGFFFPLRIVSTWCTNALNIIFSFCNSPGSHQHGTLWRSPRPCSASLSGWQGTQPFVKAPEQCWESWWLNVVWCLERKPAGLAGCLNVFTGQCVRNSNFSAFRLCSYNRHINPDPIDSTLQFCPSDYVSYSPLLQLKYPIYLTYLLQVY